MKELKVVKRIPYLGAKEWPQVGTIFKEEQFTDGGLVLQTLVNGGIIEVIKPNQQIK